ncbi:MAG: hypothetical protein WBZ29_05260 [Methanocella sp.]
MGIESLSGTLVRFFFVSAFVVACIVMISGAGYCDYQINPNIPLVKVPPMISVSPNPACEGQTVTVTGSFFNTTPYPGDTHPLAGCPMIGSGIFVIQPNGTFTAQTSFHGAGTIVIYAGDKWGHMTAPVNLTILATATPTPTPTPTPQPGTSTPTQTPQATLAPDTVAPVTTLSLTGVKDASGVYTSNVVCTLTATDNGDWTKVNETQYSLDGFTWTKYTGPFTITTPGNTTIFYRSSDAAGNQEIAKVEAITLAGSVATPTSANPGSGLCGAMLLPLLLAGFVGVYRHKKS